MVDSVATRSSFYANVRATDSSGVEVFWMHLHQNQKTKCFVDSTWLALGEYQVEAENSGGGTRKLLLTVRENQTDDVSTVIEVR